MVTAAGGYLHSGPPQSANDEFLLSGGLPVQAYNQIFDLGSAPRQLPKRSEEEEDEEEEEEGEDEEEEEDEEGEGRGERREDSSSAETARPS